ncbi:MAG: hypothetical protein ACRD0V_17895 [Acidimicrobiales bacterium]
MRRVHNRLFVLALAVIAIAVMVLTFGRCGARSTGHRGSAEPTAPMSPTVDHRTIVRALETTRAVESGRLEVAFVLTHLGHEPDPPPDGRLPVAVYRVAFDRRARRVDVETDMSGAASVVGARDAPAAGDLSIAARMVAVGDVVYAQGGLMAAAFGRTPSDWVRIDRATFVDRGPRSDAGSLVLDPFGPFQVLGDTTADARLIGDDEIRGSPVTHLATRAGSGGGAAPVEVWIDADGVIRRMEIRLAGGVGAGAAGLVTTVDLFDIGHPVDITPPGAER